MLLKRCLASAPLFACTNDETRLRSGLAVSTGFKCMRSLNDITLPFKQHNDPKGSNFMVEARGYTPSERGGLTKDVIFIKK
jgi:hypothetical protein